MQQYKLFDHTADLGIEIYGRTKKDLFAQAGLALFDILIQAIDTQPKAKGAYQKRMVTVEGADVEDLLVNFLRELLYLYNASGCIVNRSKFISCTNKRLAVQLVVEPYNPKRHLIKTDLKAITYHGLSVEKTKSGWKARVIFDV